MGSKDSAPSPSCNGTGITDTGAARSIKHYSGVPWHDPVNFCEQRERTDSCLSAWRRKQHS